MATTVASPVGSHDNDWTSAEIAAGRNVGLSFEGVFEEGARAAGAVACFVRFSKSTATALSAASISPATGPTTCRPI
jgi:hypothetical protein